MHTMFRHNLFPLLMSYIIIFPLLSFPDHSCPHLLLRTKRSCHPQYRHSTDTESVTVSSAMTPVTVHHNVIKLEQLDVLHPGR